VAAAEQALDVAFPPDLREALLAVNGGEAFVADGAYLMLWAPDELAESNTDYEAPEMAPGYVLIGSSGGGEAYAIARGTGAFVTMPILPLDGREAEPLGDTFLDFLEALARQTDDEG
jgi:hypothetical protein